MEALLCKNSPICDLVYRLVYGIVVDRAKCMMMWSAGGARGVRGGRGGGGGGGGGGAARGGRGGGARARAGGAPGARAAAARPRARRRQEAARRRHGNYSLTLDPLSTPFLFLFSHFAS